MATKNDKVGLRTLATDDPLVGHGEWIQSERLIENAPGGVV